MARRLIFMIAIRILLGHPFRRMHVLGDLDDIHTQCPRVANAAPRVQHAPLRIEQIRVGREPADLHAGRRAQSAWISFGSVSRLVTWQ